MRLSITKLVEVLEVLSYLTVYFWAELLDEQTLGNSGQQQQ